jgi:hypothetical protein
LTDEGLLLFDIMGPAASMIILQSLFALAVFLGFKARRFGRPAVLYESVKRLENENLLALANIYMKNGAGQVVIEAFLGRFKSRLARFLGFHTVPEDSELIAAVSLNANLREKNIGSVLKACELYLKSGSTDERQMQKLVKAMEEIGREIV